MIIGLTGSYCSGKDTVAEYLAAEKGFIHYSLSDELRRELAVRGIAPLRENLIRIGTELRREEGTDVLARRTAARFVPGRDYIVTSIRHPAEVEELSRHPGFVLVDVDAPVDIRFRRIVDRKRPGDPDTLEKLLEYERRESQDEGPGQQLAKCRSMAEVTIKNDVDDLRELHRRIDGLLERLRQRGDGTRR